jgi:hypothetical protein
VRSDATLLLSFQLVVFTLGRSFDRAERRGQPACQRVDYAEVDGQTGASKYSPLKPFKIASSDLTQAIALNMDTVVANGKLNSWPLNRHIRRSASAG